MSTWWHNYLSSNSINSNKPFEAKIKLQNVTLVTLISLQCKQKFNGRIPVKMPTWWHVYHVGNKVFNIHIFPPMTRRNGADKSPEFNLEKCHTCDIISFRCDANFMKFIATQWQNKTKQSNCEFCQINGRDCNQSTQSPTENMCPTDTPISQAMDRWTKDMRTVCPKHTHLSCSIWPRLHSPSIDRRRHSFSSTISINSLHFLRLLTS